MSDLTMTQPLCNEHAQVNGDEALYEIIDGQHVELPPMSILAARLLCRLYKAVAVWVDSQRVGEAVMETLLQLPLPLNRNRRPDLAFISTQRLAQAPAQPGSDNAWKVAPDLFAEVISPTDLAEVIQEKLHEYFQAGARLVWIIYPTQRTVSAYRSPTEVHILKDTEELDGGDVLPGFRVSIASLFPQ